MRVYLDSNVLISALRSEIDKAFNLRFRDSEDFFTLCRMLKIEVVISKLFLCEVGKRISISEAATIDILNGFGFPLVLMESVRKEHALKIMKETDLHFADSLHVANALENACELIVTWNKKDFDKAKRLVPCKTPEEFKTGF